MTTHGEAIDPNDYFFQYAVYKGAEQLDNSLTDEPANKKYWNLAIGVKPAIANCQIRTMGTAEDANDPNDLVADRLIQPGNVYPVVAWDIDAATCTQEPLSFAPGGRVAALALAAATGTMIGYTPPTHTGVAFKNARSATLPPAAQCNPSRPCPAGFRCTSQGNCESVDGEEILVPAGSFWMGCNDTLDGECLDSESPQHEVQLSAYTIDKDHVTVAEYTACLNAGVCRLPMEGVLGEYVLASYGGISYGVPGRDRFPITTMGMLDATTYCGWRGQSVCTEAQWERAARGGCETIEGDCRTQMRTYPWGEEAPTCDHANFVYGCNNADTMAVGSHSPKGDSPYGVRDMGGNAWTWTADVNHGYGEANYYTYSPLRDPTGAETGSFFIVRGGTALNGPEQSGWFSSRSSWRPSNSYPQGYAGGSKTVGIRCCRPCGAPPSFALGQPDSAPGAGNAPVWSTGADGRSLTQSVNSAPSIYTTNLAADGHVLEFNLLVTNDNDDDYIGWTVGEELGGLASTGSAGDRDYLLFDWKKGAQAVCFGSLVNGVCPPAINYLRNPGLQLNRVTGPVTNYTLHAPTDPARAGHNVAMVTPAATLGATGWQLGRTYRVRMAYSTTLIQVWVTPEVKVNGSFNTANPTFRNEDRQLEFDLTGNFPDGRFGFYSNSQVNTNFRFVSLDDGAPTEFCE